MGEGTPLTEMATAGVREPAGASQPIAERLVAGKETPDFAPGAGTRYWQRCAALVLEVLAAQKLVPILVPAPDGKTCFGRWLPVLDGPKDGPRLAQLEAAMPPVCRSALVSGQEPPPPRILLSTFLNATCDALARRWGHTGAPRSAFLGSAPADRWLQSLFAETPEVRLSAAQVQALVVSQRAWLRNLHAAGDAAFRISFRLEAPESQARSPEWKLHYLLQSRQDPSLFVPAEVIWQKKGSLLNELGRRVEQPQEKLLAGLGYAGRLFPPITQSLKSKTPSSLTLDSPLAYTFLREAGPLLEGAGFGLLVPPWWNQRGARLGMRLRVRSAKASRKDAVVSGGMTFERLVNYQWELALGDATLTEEEFRALAALKSPLVQIRGQWVQLDPQQVEAAIRFWEKKQTSGDMDLLDALQYQLGGQDSVEGLPLDEVVAEDWLADWLQQIEQPDHMEELPQPAGLVGTLRPYQRYGFSWLHFHRRWGLGACLADDMGLGKTIQTIALLLREKESREMSPAQEAVTQEMLPPTLLVAPTSVVTNWEREIERFAPSLSRLVHQGAGRLRGEDFLSAARQVDVVLTSYALLRLDADLLQSIQWQGVILDEAQNIKNPAAKQTQAARRLGSSFRLALTGTPVENRLSELWSIMHFLNPGFLGSRESFRRHFALPIERDQDPEAIQRLKQLTGPFMLRRVKSDPRVIQDLPEKVETKVYCRLSEEQATLYEAVVQHILQQLEEKEGIERSGLVLSMLMQLKQICNHPAQYLHEALTPAAQMGPPLAMRSGKLERLVELLEEILAAGDRALIFTQFAEMGSLMAAYLPQVLHVPTLYLHGGTPTKARDGMVKRFQEDEHGPPLFILSLKAGGTGLNLTRANHVFHFDRWWNPAVEDQATDRAFRIGQKRNVLVHKFVTTGTLEDMIDTLIESKKGLAQAVVGSGEKWLTRLSTDELRELVKLRRV